MTHSIPQIQHHADHCQPPLTRSSETAEVGWQTPGLEISAKPCSTMSKLAAYKALGDRGTCYSKPTVQCHALQYTFFLLYTATSSCSTLQYTVGSCSVPGARRQQRWARETPAPPSGGPSEGGGRGRRKRAPYGPPSILHWPRTLLPTAPASI